MIERELLSMAPLAWVEGKPVYKGDVLWAKPHVNCKNHEHKVAEVRNGIFCNDQIYDFAGEWLVAVDLTWTPPKVKRDIKLLAYLDADQLFWLREGAQSKFQAIRVPSEDKTIVVEEQ